ncbi:MAG: hypothetical protein CO098_09750 [Bacteroidetes bacterium CG_4_9_14_3_um_filter_41_19]|nr:MAG: hypothetical protein CO098_09750 [Bacteroidetes bacterium CG_4_9_14_3_um_filter_41_19]
MKSIIGLVIFITALGFPELHAQEATLASGGTATGSGGTVCYSVGQVAYSTIESPNGTVIQGMQMPFEIFVLGIDDYIDMNLSISIYPNPTRDFIHLKLESAQFISLSFQLVDFKGTILINQDIVADETSISMENFPASIYFLRVFDNGFLLKTFKIIKH